MRKLQEAVRFPQSVQLFRFCFRVLELRQPNDKVHDQDLGSILNYNPSDTSHWKRGKKAIRNVQSLENLAKALDVDLEIIQDLADGHVDLDEAWCDFCDAEEERRLSLEEPGVRIERRDRSLEIEKVAQEILAKANVTSVPVHIPELISAFPFIQLMPGDVSDKLARSSRVRPGHYAIRFRKGDIRAHTRTAIAREIARIVLLSEREKFKFTSRCETLSQAEIVDFANALLVPREALAVEIQKISTRVNMVKALADLFWAPKSVIRSRLSSILFETASNSVFEAAALEARISVQDRSEMVDEEFLDEEFSEDSNSVSFAKKQGRPAPAVSAPNSVH
ncbi:hypothetical protein ACWNT8_01590 [Pigmentibacter ruber]|uniref:hypothetical protein n=1 Tax=Pigmentibacter ruber TaxID=2683196 RepID=UPI00131E54E8|nr:hypothetical protein [Pigmentibacter ruber]BFD30956.1 hypothetical protein GTC16762_05740 [Pigmentibacter ruber]